MASQCRGEGQFEIFNLKSQIENFNYSVFTLDLKKMAMTYSQAAKPNPIVSPPSRGLGSSSATSPVVRAASRRTFEAQMIILFGLIFVTAFVIFAALRFAGDYYRAPLVERPKHALHETFKPSGVISQGFGVVGGIFCILTLLYPMRKRWRLLENLGTPRRWFQFHIYFGIAGPLLATLHTTFKLGGLASICYWSMMLVMASGFIGRFLFALLPRNQRGLALSLQDIDGEIQAIQRQLETAGIRTDQNDLPARMDKRKVPHGQARQTGWRDLIRLWMVRRRNLRAWNRRLLQQNFNSSSVRKILSLLSRKLFLESSLATLALTTRAFSHWHTLHLPFTYIMFITLIIHVGLAIFLGYTWIF